MSLRFGRVLIIWLVFTAGFLSACTSTAKEVYKGVDRIVAVGDLHGDYDQYIKIMTSNGLIGKNLKWQGGETHYVQLGDVVDRGPDSMKIIRHLMKLEKQAKKKGGRVHFLIGNHEAMNVQGDLRYVHPGEYAALADRKSEGKRDRYIDAVYQHRLSIDPTIAENQDAVMQGLKQEFPLGYVEHRMLWEPRQKIARWVASHNTVVQVNDSLFVHGGLNPHTEHQQLADINRQVKKELSAPLEGEGLSNSQQGPLWYRGLAENDAEVELAPLIKMLDFYGVNRIFIAHTPTQGVILARFDGRVIMVDVGISAYYGSSLANVVIEDGVLQVMHRGTLVPFPSGDQPIDDYLKTVSELEPPGSRLRRYVDSLNKPVIPEEEAIPAEGTD